MKERQRLLIAMIGFAWLATPIAARVIDYSADDTAMLKDAAELKIQPISEPLKRGERDIELVVSPDVDHIATALGMYCSAYKVENPISRILRRMATDWDRDGTLDNSSQKISRATLRIKNARSYRRCVELKEANVRCLTRVAIMAEVEVSNAEGVVRQAAIAADVERDASVSGICGNLARGIGVVSREAGIALIKDAESKLNAMAAAR